MTGPRRLKEEDGFTGALLRSASDDGPRADARRAIAAAVGIGAIAPAALGQATVTAATVATASPPVAGAAASAAAAPGAIAAPAAVVVAAPAAIVVKASASIAAKLLVGFALTTGVGVGVGVAVQTSAPARAPISEPTIPTSRTQVTREPRSASLSPAASPQAPTTDADADVGDVTSIPRPVDPPMRPVAPAEQLPVRREGTSGLAARSTAAPVATESQEAPGAAEAPAHDQTAVNIAPPAEPPEVAVATPAPVTSIADEVALLDVAVAALRRGEARAALLALERYDRKYPRGVLAPEATVARIEALVATGDLDGARALARTFFADNGDSPLAHRVRQSIRTK